MAHHRQRAAQMNRDELSQLADQLIQRAHQQERLIMELQRVAANLMVEIEVLKPAEGPPGFAPVRNCHMEWARELRERMP